MNSPVLFLVLDAFRWDYLSPEKTPFLWKLKQEGLHVKKVRTASGFTQRTTIFTGAWADVTGRWTMHCYDPDASPFRFLAGKSWTRWAQAAASALPGVAGRVVEAQFRTRIYGRARAQARHPSTARIPLHLLRFFAMSEDERPVQEPGALGVPSLFDAMHEAGVAFNYLMYPEVDGSDASTEAALVQGAGKDFKVWFGLLSGADQVGHAHGPRSPETARACTQLDNRLHRIHKAFQKAGRPPTWLVVGDHGMVEVTARVDALRALRRTAQNLGLVEAQDWLAFCDSTTVKVWALRPEAKAFLDAAFTDLEGRGRILDADMARRRRIPFGDRRYGDRVWLADPGVLVRPDFFHRREERVLGMHGYDPGVEGQKGLALVHGPGIPATEVEEAPLADVCPTLCHLLGVSVPSKNEGQSWLEPATAGVGGTP